MGTPFLSEIKIVSFNFPPKGWAMCNGQFLPINQNQALFSLLGTQFGGNGQTTFALPDFRGRAPVHMGGGFTIGQAGGQTAHTVTQQELPTHQHIFQATNTNGNSVQSNGTILAAALNVYRTADQLTPISPASVSPIGGSQAHNNMQPYLVLNFCIALVGVFPSQN